MLKIYIFMYTDMGYVLYMMKAGSTQEVLLSDEMVCILQNGMGFPVMSSSMIWQLNETKMSYNLEWGVIYVPIEHIDIKGISLSIV